VEDPSNREPYVGRELFATSGHKLGTIDEVYVDRETGAPAFAVITSGLFGTIRRFVPLLHVGWLDDDLVVPHSRDKVRVAPNPEHDGRLTQSGEADMYAYYGLPYTPIRGDVRLRCPKAKQAAVARDVMESHD
jgi:sporulation protein YlmC with PRC-barrel domain